MANYHRQGDDNPLHWIPFQRQSKSKGTPSSTKVVDGSVVVSLTPCRRTSPETHHGHQMKGDTPGRMGEKIGGETRRPPRCRSTLRQSIENNKEETGRCEGSR
ncbi:tyrosine--tRNA ligase [Striga asiatica]|uniref:Tyrosine--tRNA ligase n=1 Tax=Striga asiatica TaxID=4170 RepID=A0A5A7R662_STRAF|nr:tyrosine--tRNA ligase [Striga asiatica]